MKSLARSRSSWVVRLGRVSDPTRGSASSWSAASPTSPKSIASSAQALPACSLTERCSCATIGRSLPDARKLSGKRMLLCVPSYVPVERA